MTTIASAIAELQSERKANLARMIATHILTEELAINKQQIAIEKTVTNLNKLRDVNLDDPEAVNEAIRLMPQVMYVGDAQYDMRQFITAKGVAANIIA